MEEALAQLAVLSVRRAARQRVIARWIGVLQSVKVCILLPAGASPFFSVPGSSRPPDPRGGFVTLLLEPPRKSKTGQSLSPPPLQESFGTDAFFATWRRNEAAAEAARLWLAKNRYMNNKIKK